MHIPLTFQLIKRLPFLQTSSTLWSIPTNQPHDILFKKQHSCQHTITQPSHFHYLLTQLIIHHNFHTINSISFFRPRQLASPSIHCQHPRTLSSLSHLLQITNFNHPPSQLLINFSLSTQTTYIPHPNQHTKVPIRPPITLQAMLACSKMRGSQFLC